MKAILLTMTILFSTLAMAEQPVVGELHDDSKCECQTCLIENGICIRNNDDSSRLYVPDKSGSSKTNSQADGSANPQ